MPYSIYTASGFLAFLGLYTGALVYKPHSQTCQYICLVLTYIDVSAASNGVDDNFAFYLVSIANASSMLGRVGAGYLTDKIGEEVSPLLHSVISDVYLIRRYQCYGTVYSYCRNTDVYMAIHQRKVGLHRDCRPLWVIVVSDCNQLVMLIYVS